METVDIQYVIYKRYVLPAWKEAITVSHVFIEDGTLFMPHSFREHQKFCVVESNFGISERICKKSSVFSLLNLLLFLSLFKIVQIFMDNSPSPHGQYNASENYFGKCIAFPWYFVWSLFHLGWLSRVGHPLLLVKGCLSWRSMNFLTYSSPTLCYWL